jgi:hypothetical protein
MKKTIIIILISILVATIVFSLTSNTTKDNITAIASIFVALVALKSLFIGSNFDFIKYFKYKSTYLNWYKLHQSQSFNPTQINWSSKLSTRFIQATHNSTLDNTIKDEVISFILKTENITCDTGCGNPATVFLCDKCASCNNCHQKSNDVINPDEPT